MTRARALAAAVPQRVYTAVAGLVLLASMGVALLLGAGLATWRGGVENTPGQQGAAPPSVVAPPRGAVIVVPTPKPPATHAPAPTTPAPTVQRVVTVVAAPPRTPQTLSVTAAEKAVAKPRVTGASPAKQTKQSKHAKPLKAPHSNHGKHLGWTKGARGNGHGHGKGTTRTHG